MSTGQEWNIKDNVKISELDGKHKHNNTRIHYYLSFSIPTTITPEVVEVVVDEVDEDSTDSDSINDDHKPFHELIYDIYYRFVEIKREKNHNKKKRNISLD